MHVSQHLSSPTVSQRVRGTSTPVDPQTRANLVLVLFLLVLKSLFGVPVQTQERYTYQSRTIN